MKISQKLKTDFLYNTGSTQRGICPKKKKALIQKHK